MAVFSPGAVVPVLLSAYGSRRGFAAGRASLASVAAIGKPVMGGFLLLVAALAITGTDKLIEGWMVRHLPDWLVDLTTRF